MILSSTVERAGEELRSIEGHSYRGYGRLFGNLPAWKPPPNVSDLEQYLWSLAEGMYVDAVEDNHSIPAGYTYLGQLINHDLTFDASSTLEEKREPILLRNFRTPRFDLDCVYGRGPRDQSYLYELDGSGKLVLGTNRNGELDLPRNPFATRKKSLLSQNPFDLQGLAVIGDSRNDENIIVSQLHLAFLRFHNRQIDKGIGFEEARRLTRWHYQWVAIHDYLKRLCGDGLVDEVLGTDGRPCLRFFDPRTHPYVPIEFAVAAYRGGHSMVRTEYALSSELSRLRGGARLSIFGGIPEDNLVGGRVLPPGWTVQWNLFVGQTDQAELQFSKRLGPQLSRPLRFLPMPAEPPRLRSLAFRTLLRGWRMALPSGQDVARRMAEPVIDGNDPLWVYVLKEAYEAGGHHLGPVGARIVTEVFIGLLAADPHSYFAIEPNWMPTSGPRFGLENFLAEAGVSISKEQWENRLQGAAQTRLQHGAAVVV